jgi:hypothetical protein
LIITALIFICIYDTITTKTHRAISQLTCIIADHTLAETIITGLSIRRSIITDFCTSHDAVTTDRRTYRGFTFTDVTILNLTLRVTTITCHIIIVITSFAIVTV